MKKYLINHFLKLLGGKTPWQTAKSPQKIEEAFCLGGNLPCKAGNSKEWDGTAREYVAI